MSVNADTGIITGSEFDASSTRYAKPKMNPSGGKNVAVLNDATGKPLYISTPLMLTWGVNEWTNESTGSHTYDLSLQFPREQDSNYNEAMTQFLEGLVSLEEKIKSDTSTTYHKEWFNKPKMSPEVIDALWTPMLRYPKGEDGEPDRTRSPSLRIKIPFWDGKFNTELYDLEGECLFPNDDDTVSPMSLVQKGQNIAAVIQCGGIWFANGKFGVTWKLLQAVVQPRATLKGRCHIQLDTASREMLRSGGASTEEDSNELDVPENTTAANDTDEEAEPEPPKPKAAKKRVVKGKGK